MPAALSFTDEQLSAILRAATPIPPADRTRFLEQVATKLEGQTLGDGVVFRAIRETQGRYLNPPERLCDRQIARLRTLENPTSVIAGLSEHVAEVSSVGNQAASLCILAPLMDRRNGMACRQCDKRVALAGEKRISGDDECIGPQCY
jgi:hypothetical protein